MSLSLSPWGPGTWRELVLRGARQAGPQALPAGGGQCLAEPGRPFHLVGVPVSGWQGSGLSGRRGHKLPPLLSPFPPTPPVDPGLWRRLCPRSETWRGLGAESGPGPQAPQEGPISQGPPFLFSDSCGGCQFLWQRHVGPAGWLEPWVLSQAHWGWWALLPHPGFTHRSRRPRPQSLGSSRMEELGSLLTKPLCLGLMWAADMEDRLGRGTWLSWVLGVAGWSGTALLSCNPRFNVKDGSRPR